LSAARELRQYVERSNAIHQSYLGDRELLEKYERFVDWQLAYMLPFYDDLRALDHYAAAVYFVVTDLTGTGVSQRDHDIARVVPIMSRMLPDKALRTLASAMQLNASVLDINLSICKALYKGKSVESELTEADYRSACRQASSLDECLELVQLIEEIGRSLDHVIRIPMIGFTLKAMRKPTHLAGFAALQTFLENGYTIFSALDDVDQFLDDITNRMSDVFTKIFTGPLEQPDHPY
jgi:hypothetical protein